MGKIHSRNNEPKLESAQEVFTFTPRQLLEIAKCTFDPRYFIDTYLKTMSTKGPVPFLAHSYQQTQLRAFAKHSVFCLQPRQSGATSLPLAYQLWEAIFRSDTLHGATFVQSADAVEGIKLLKHWVDNLPTWLCPTVKHLNQQIIEFDNGSKIICGKISSNFNVGRSWTTLLADCLAFAKDQDQEDFWLSVVPTLSYGGRAFITGTPNGPSNTFAHLWSNINVSQPTNFIALQVDPLSVFNQATLDSIRSIIGDRTYKREYECEFIA